MTWLLCDYGEVLCLAPSDVDRATLVAAADWDPTRGDFWTAYWADRPGYDRGDLSVKEYWARLLGYPPLRPQLEDLIAADAAGWLHPNLLSLAAAERAAGAGCGWPSCRTRHSRWRLISTARPGWRLFQGASLVAGCER